MGTERGRAGGRALTEIRTVLSRARTARDGIAHNPEREPGEWVYDVPRTDPYGRDYMAARFVSNGPAEFDPDQADMLAALDAFITAAQRWERTGRPLKGNGS